MPDNIDQFHNDFHQRKILQKYFIKDNLDEITTWGDQTTGIFDNGNIITIETNYRCNNNGEIINHPDEIVGKCQAKKCGNYLTIRKIRNCYFCGE